MWAADRYKDKYGKKPTWKFIPPGAPEQGGAWERLVQSVKRALHKMDIPEVMTDEELQNLLIKVEALINARPLTEIPTHPSAPALTPNHFLFGNSTGEPGEVEDVDETEDYLSVYRRLLLEEHEHRQLLRQYWDRWSKEYLPLIAARPKWKRKTAPLQEGDLVFICDPTGWVRGIITETLTDPETDQVREAMIKTTRGLYRRPATKIAKILVERDTMMDADDTMDVDGAPEESEPENAMEPEHESGNRAGTQDISGVKTRSQTKKNKE